MRWGQGIKTAREESDLSKYRLAKMIEVDGSYITHLEAGRRVPSLEVLEKIAKACEITLTNLVWLCEDE